MEFTNESGKLLVVSFLNNRTNVSDNFLEMNYSGLNGTDMNFTMGDGGAGGIAEIDYIFDRPDIRAIFITLYTIVFCSCFLGNLMVVLVATCHWRMRSITNFCLANLAFADLCVGIFCVYQNLSTYLIASWVFGDFLCKMYHFINSLSHTASILILVVICVERYLAIIHPMRCKQLLTLNRLRVTIVLVWISSAVYSIPRLYYINTITMVRHDGEKEIICIPKRTLYDSVTFDLISMVVLFIVPLAAITVLYTIIGIALWRSSRSRIPSSSVSETSSSNNSYAEYDTQTETPGGMRPVQVPTASRSRRRKSVSAGRLWCGGWCVRRAWRRRRSRSSGSRKGRRRRGSSCLYEESSSPHTNLVCYHYSPGGVNGLNRTSSIEDNGNHHRHITSCSHCDCDHHHHHPKAPLGECVEDTGVTTVAHPCLNGSVCSADSSNTRGSSVMLVSSGACNSCSRPSKKRGRRGSFDTTASPEPLVLVKIKKRGPFYNRTEGHSSALLQSSSTATSSFDGCCSSAAAAASAAAAVEAENNRTNLYLSERSGEADGHRPSSCHGNQLNQRTTIIDENISHEQNGTSLLGTGGSRKHGNSPHGVINICSNGGATRLLNDKKLHGSPCACSAGGSAFTNAVPGGALGGASLHGIPGASCSMNRRNYTSSNEIGTHNKPPTTRLKRMRVVRMSKYGTRALQSRRRIIRMLIVIVVAFAVCNLPFHARKMWQNYSKSYQGGSTFSSILTPVTFLIMYANSGINPLLYAFMSHKFRSSFKDLLTCKLRRSSRANRRPLARSTHIIPVSTAV